MITSYRPDFARHENDYNSRPLGVWRDQSRSSPRYRRAISPNWFGRL